MRDESDEQEEQSMRSPEMERDKRLRREAIGRERAYGLRGVVTRNRRIDAQKQLNSMSVRALGANEHITQLRILTAGHGAAGGDVGKFWFVPGWSDHLSGHPDILYVP